MGLEPNAQPRTTVVSRQYGVLAAAVDDLYCTSGSGPLGFLIFFAGTASIAFATAHRPGRTKQRRAGHGGVPY